MNSLNFLVNYLKPLNYFLEMQHYLFDLDAASLYQNVLYLIYHAQ